MTKRSVRHSYHRVRVGRVGPIITMRLGPIGSVIVAMLTFVLMIYVFVIALWLATAAALVLGVIALAKWAVTTEAYESLLSRFRRWRAERREGR